VYLNQKYDVTFKNWQTLTSNAFTPTLATVNYYLFTANTLATLGQSSITINSGQQIISNNQPFVQYRIIWDISSPATWSINPYISDITLSWVVDESVYLPCAIVKDRRYWFSAAVSPSISNSLILVLDKNNNWTKFSGINARSFSYFNSRLYFGSSDDTGLVYQYDDDYTLDTTSSIATMVHTKDFDLGSRLNNKHIAMEGLWTFTEPTALYANMTVGYHINKSTTAEISVNIPITPDADYPSEPIITRMRNYTDRFRYISFKLTNFNILNGLDLFYVKDPLAEE